jgi:hypothetical protein
MLTQLMDSDTHKTWKVVSEFSTMSQPEYSFFNGLNELIDGSGLKCTRLECGKNYKAIVISLTSLSTTAQQIGGELLIEGVSDAHIDASDQAIFVSPIRDESLIDELFSGLSRKIIAGMSPYWVGINPSVKDQMLLRHLQTLGATEPNGTIKVPAREGSLLKFDLYQILPDPGNLLQSLASGAAQKIPEGPDNLRRRARWFRQRTGSPE